MAAVPFALSVHNLVSSVGADAGFAAVVGLAILALLYFAHARETANLREEAGVLAQRLQEAEARLEIAHRAQPAPAPASVPTAPAPRTLATGLAPAAPAGVGAPALAAATSFITVVHPPAPAVAVASPPTTVAPALAAAAAHEAPSVVGSPAPAAPSVPPPAPPPQSSTWPPVPAPATVAALRSAASATAEGTNGSSAGTATVMGRDPVAGADAPVRAPQGSFPPPNRPVLTTSGPLKEDSGVWRRFGLLLAVLLVIGAAAAVVILTSSNGNSTPASPPASNTPKPAATFDPAHFNVAVLNGTATNQLAHKVGAKLAADGFAEGRLATASNQTVTSTIVAYLPGPGNRQAALHVAKTLHLKPSAVAPIDPDTQAVACPSAGNCPADVVVTVGADLATTS